MKELKSWEDSIATIEKVYVEAENLVKIHGEPEEAAQTGFDIASVKGLLLDLKIDFKNAKDVIVKEDNDIQTSLVNQAKTLLSSKRK